MTLRLASDDVEEVRGALWYAYGEVIRELGQYGLGYSPAGIQLCRRKWKLEAMLRQLDGPEEPPPPLVLEMVPRRAHATLEQVAA
jgi:hypothetical protein